MNTDDIKMLVDLYTDGELPKEKEPVLFSLLSADPEAREYFKCANYLKNNFQVNMSEFPSSLEENILRSVENSGKKQSTVFTNKNIFLFFFIFMCRNVDFRGFIWLSVFNGIAYKILKDSN